MSHRLRYHPALWLTLTLLSTAATAQTPNDHQAHHPVPAAAAAAAPNAAVDGTPAAAAAWAQAEVRRIDTKAGKVTLKHGDIQNLGMPPMTMVFQVRDPQALTHLKVGERVRFTADRINGAYTVLQIEPAP